MSTKTLESVRRAYDRACGQRDSVIKDLAAEKKNRKALVVLQDSIKEAQTIVAAVAAETQNAFTVHLSDLATLGLETVFDEPYKLRVEFETKRNRSEASIFFEPMTNEEGRIDPLEASGGGVVDIASFALRVSLWTLTGRTKRRSAPVMILDEPFRFVSQDLQPRASQLLKEVSKRLGIQFIIVTHEQELIEEADRVFRVEKKNGRSTVKVEA